MRFHAAKSPLLAGTVMQVGTRRLVAWANDSVDAEAWLHLTSGRPPSTDTLTMTNVDPEADFSFDFEDLSFTRVGACE